MKTGVKSIFFLLLCANLPLILLGQKQQEPDPIELTGVLLSSDSLHPISDAEVYSRQNLLGTFTDSNGNFTITVVLGDTLLFSSLGYGDMEVGVDEKLLSSKPPVHFYMKPDTIQIQEVVIHAHWDYRTFKQKILNMKMQTHPLNWFNDAKIKPAHQKPYDEGFHLFSPIQSMYNIFNAKAVLERKLIRNRKAYNRNMIKLGRPQDTIPTMPGYMREKQH